MSEVCTRQEFDAATRADFMTFVERAYYELNPGAPYLPSWHIELLVAELEEVRRGRQRRTIFNLPPRHLKSLCISVAFVAWMLGHDPSLKIMVVSYGQELAEKLARDTRQIMTSKWYRSLFPRTRLKPSRQSVHDFETTAGGGRMAVSRGGPITGRGADLIIIDDPTKADEVLSEGMREATNEYIAHTVLTRLNDKATGAVILAMQRLHEDDQTGRLMRSGMWRLVSLPAIAPERETWTYDTPFGPRVVTREAGEALHPAREPLPVLQEIRQVQGDYHFTAQYQQNPIPASGNLVPIGRFLRYTPGTEPAVFDTEILSVDTAFKDNALADYSVITHWGLKGKDTYLLRVYRFKATFFELKAKLRAVVQDVRPSAILIEDCASGQSLIQEFRNEGMAEVRPIKPKGDKAVRMMEASILIEGGQVHIPSDAPWLGEYLHELAGFPNARFDDQVDSTSQALNWIRERAHEPGIIRYYREEAQKVLGVDNDAPSVAMRPPAGCSGGTGIEGDVYTVDWTTGLVWVRLRDVNGFRAAGWAVQEGP